MIYYCRQMATGQNGSAYIIELYSNGRAELVIDGKDHSGPDLQYGVCGTYTTAQDARRAAQEHHDFPSSPLQWITVP